jgi:hypothetical protein
MIRTPALAAAALLLTAGAPAWAQSNSWAQSLDSSWSGPYLGVNGGWFQSTNRSVSNSGTDTGTAGLGSLRSGGQYLRIPVLVIRADSAVAQLVTTGKLPRCGCSVAR